MPRARLSGRNGLRPGPFLVAGERLPLRIEKFHQLAILGEAVIIGTMSPVFPGDLDRRRRIRRVAESKINVVGAAQFVEQRKAGELRRGCFRKVAREHDHINGSGARRRGIPDLFENDAVAAF